jgi:hypothetical protein
LAAQVGNVGIGFSAVLDCGCPGSMYCVLEVDSDEFFEVVSDESYVYSDEYFEANTP